MMKNKGILMTNTVSVILAVLGLIAIFYGLYKVYTITAYTEEEKSAQNTIAVFMERIDSLKENQKTETILQGFKQTTPWFLQAFTTENPNRPDKCGLENCVCICQEDCKKESFCRKTQNQIRFYAQTSQGQTSFPEDMRISIRDVLFKITVEKNNQTIEVGILVENSQPYIEEKVLPHAGFKQDRS